MNTEKLVSILLPVKNEELFIEMAIQSVLSQTYKNLELIIIDDSSTDHTLSIATAYERENKIIKVLTNPGIGKASAFNHGYENSNGELFIFFAGDDILVENSIELRVKYITNKNAAYGQILTISDDKKFNGRKIPRFGNKGHISGGTLIFNTSLAKKIFPIPNSLPNEDTWTMLCIKYFALKPSNIPFIVIKYRIHKNNSHNRYMPFDKINIFLGKRNKVYNLFLKNKKSVLTKSNVRELIQFIDAEELRLKGKWFSLLVKNKLPIMTKKSFLFNSNSLLYRLKLFLSFL